MAYPQNVIRTFPRKLSRQESFALEQTLSVAGIKAILDQKLLPFENFVSPAGTVLTAEKAQHIVSIYNNNSAFFSMQSSTVKLHDLIIWLKIETEYHPYVPSEYEVNKIIQQPEQFLSFVSVLQTNPTPAKNWALALDNYEKLKLAKQTSKKTIFNNEIAPLMFSLYSFVTQQTILADEFKIINEATSQYVNLRPKPLEQAARIYFRNFFQTQGKRYLQDEFFSKAGGRQLGRRMRITYESIDPSQPGIMKTDFFIKTYQGGSLATEQHSTTQPIEPKELFIYKVFEYVGVGPKIYFFINTDTRKSLFIATQDSAFTKSADKSKIFEEYEKLQQLFFYHPIMSRKMQKKLYQEWIY